MWNASPVRSLLPILCVLSGSESEVDLVHSCSQVMHQESVHENIQDTPGAISMYWKMRMKRLEFQAKEKKARKERIGTTLPY